MPAPFNVADLARALSDADESGSRIAAASLAEPGTHEQAVAVQLQALAQSGLTTAGFKTAIRPDGSSVSAPMGHVTHASEAGTAAFERPALDALEVEICFVLASDLPPPGGEPYTRETILEHVGGLYSGVEFIGYRLDECGKAPPMLFLADRLGNAGYVVGEELSRDVLEPRALPLSITVNGEPLFPGPGRHPNDDPVAPLVVFANALTETVAAGRIITTGSLCGAIALPKGRAAIAMGGFTTLTITTMSRQGA